MRIHIYAIYFNPAADDLKIVCWSNSFFAFLCPNLWFLLQGLWGYFFAVIALQVAVFLTCSLISALPFFIFLNILLNIFISLNSVFLQELALEARGYKLSRIVAGPNFKTALGTLKC